MIPPYKTRSYSPHQSWAQNALPQDNFHTWKCPGEWRKLEVGSEGLGQMVKARPLNSCLTTSKKLFNLCSVKRASADYWLSREMLQVPEHSLWLLIPFYSPGMSGPGLRSSLWHLPLCALCRQLISTPHPHSCYMVLCQPPVTPLLVTIAAQSHPKSCCLF